MKQVIIRSGTVHVDEIPAPVVEAGSVLVAVDHSCISIGTEMSGVRTSALPLWKRALKQPENVKKVMEMISTQGLARTRSLVQSKLTYGNPTGYSAAGVVLAVGEGVTEFQVGDRVACAGAQCAHHAEVIRVPKNLTVPVPDALPYAVASTVTLGAIAMQGVRRATPTLGETFVVVGLGILGQITAQLLKANGCRVIGTDLDLSRIETAKSLGMDIALHPELGGDIEQVFRHTDGYGADGVIITAASASDEIISLAFKMCRKKGRVVLVGDVGLDLNRADFYQKELDFFISSSYGPGRYDNAYEERGLEYPLPFVRWTENRNMAEYLRLCAEGRLRVEPLVSKTYSIAQAGEAYEELKSSNKHLMVLLQYDSQAARAAAEKTRIDLKVPTASSTGKVRMALIGAGGFAKGMHLPNMTSLENKIQLKAIVSRTGHNATATAKQYAAEYAATDAADVLCDSNVDAVVICTRHDTHTQLALSALQAGKHVLLEKPLSLNRQELRAIEDFYKGRQNAPLLLTGFNRRFSKFVQQARQILEKCSNPMIINYRMNAGFLPSDHWAHGAEGGGRNIGEACHIYDVFTYLTNSRFTDVKVSTLSPRTSYYSARDNFIATIQFADGSVASLTYTASGAKDFPKETCEIFCDGKVLQLDDYKALHVYGASVKGVQSSTVEKGQKEELEAFADAIQKGGEWPIPLWQQLQATEISFLVEEQLGGQI